MGDVHETEIEMFFFFNINLDSIYKWYMLASHMLDISRAEKNNSDEKDLYL